MKTKLNIGVGHEFFENCAADDQGIIRNRVKIKEKIKEKSEVNCFAEICENLYIKRRSNIQYSIADQLSKSKTDYEDKKNEFVPFKKYTIYFKFWIRSKIKDQACSSRKQAKLDPNYRLEIRDKLSLIRSRLN